MQPSLEGQPIPEAGQQQGATASENDAHGQPATALDITPFLQGIEAAIRDLIAEEDQIERERQEHREVRDLDAQEAMAFWAKAMLWTTVGGVGLTFVGLVLIGFTLHHTRRAADYAASMVKEAEGATKAAQATVDVTRDSAERQLRAYLSLKEAVAYLEIGKRPTVNVVLANAGQTPARNLVIGYLTMVAVDPNSAKVYFRKPASPPSTTVVGGGQTVSFDITGQTILTQELMAAMERREFYIMVAGRAVYQDVFRKTRRLVFKGFLRVLPDGRTAISGTAKGNRAS